VSHEIVAAELDRLRALGSRASAAGPLLVRLAGEGAALYQGRGPDEATRLRGYVVATLGDVGPPAEAAGLLHDILLLEESPYLLAAAARAAARMGPAAAAVRPTLDRILASDVHDDFVCLAAYNALATEANGTTARREAERALDRIGDAGTGVSDCCAASRPSEPPRARDVELGTVVFTDHDGARRSFGATFDRPAALGFFYTGCANPRKCSATVARFAALQRAVEAAGLGGRTRVVLVTLDPANDSPTVMRRYAEARGFVPGPESPILGADGDALARMASALGAAVAFGEGRVSIHGVELFVLDSGGRLVARFGSAWVAEDVVRRLRSLSRRGARVRVRPGARGGSPRPSPGDRPKAGSGTARRTSRSETR
jgi:protein SCO1/2